MQQLQRCSRCSPAKVCYRQALDETTVQSAGKGEHPWAHSRLGRWADACATAPLACAGVQVIRDILDQGRVPKEYARGIDDRLRTAELESIQDYIAESDNLVSLHGQVGAMRTRWGLEQGRRSKLSARRHYVRRQRVRMPQRVLRAMHPPLCVVDRPVRWHPGAHGAAAGQVPVRSGQGGQGGMRAGWGVDDGWYRRTQAKAEATSWHACLALRLDA